MRKQYPDHFVFNVLRSSCYLLLIYLVIIGFSSCASVKGVSESPMRVGVGAEMAPGIQLGNGGSSAHLLLGYSWVPFKGGGGHSNFFQGGLQYRYAFSKDAPEGIWAGVETTYLLISNSGGGKQKANGFTAGALCGYRFKIAQKVPVSFYIAPAYLSRGGFKANGMTGPGSTGFYGRAGFEFHLFSLLYKRGR